MQAHPPFVLAASDGPNWSRLILVVGAFVAVIAVREVIVKVIHAHHREGDGGGRRSAGSNADDDAP